MQCLSSLLCTGRWWIPLIVLALDFSVAGVLPESMLKGLESEDFKTRETAQAELLAWSRQRPEKAMDALFREYHLAEDPEVRRRCHDVLRDLVTDEYLREGEGYVGIFMQEEAVVVPKDTELRRAIRITQLVPDSPAERAKLQVGDLIVSMEDTLWRDPGAMSDFGEKIRGYKPGAKIRLGILRGGKLEDFTLELGRRPPEMGGRFFGEEPEALEASDRAAKEAYFRRWLSLRKIPE